MSNSFKRASIVLMNNGGNLYEKNYSLVLRVNPRLTNTRLNSSDAKPKAKPKAPEPKGISYKI